MRSHYLFYFLFFLHFILRISLLTTSQSLLSSSRPSLHHRSHKPSRRPFSPLPISQAQPLQTINSIVDLISPDVDPFLRRRSHKPSCHRPFRFAGLVDRNQNGQGIGHGSWLSSGVRWYRGRDRCALAVVVPCFVVSGWDRVCSGVRWLCRVLWYWVEIGFALVCIGIGFVLCCCVGGGCAVFCGAVVFFFFPTVD